MVDACGSHFPSKLEWDQIPKDPVQEDRAIRSSGFFSGSVQGVLLEISWTFLYVVFSVRYLAQHLRTWLRKKFVLIRSYIDPLTGILTITLPWKRGD